MTRRSLAAVALMLASPLSGCGRAEPRAMVFVAASLAAPFEELERAFEQARGADTLEVHAAGTPSLLLQLRAGAPVDLFVPADLAHMDQAIEAVGASAAPLPIARGHLSLAVRAGNPKRVEGLADLIRPDLVPLLCGPEVPAGRYARTLLAQVNLPARSASDEPSVQGVVSKLRLGEADVGLVYHTDVLAHPDLEEIPLPSAQQVPVLYLAARLDSGQAPGPAGAFLKFLRSTEARAILRSHGFEEVAP